MVLVYLTALFIPFCKEEQLSLKELKQHVTSQKIVGWNSDLLEKDISQKRHHNLIHGIRELGSPDGVSGRSPGHLQVGYSFFLPVTSMQRLTRMHPF